MRSSCRPCACPRRSLPRCQLRTSACVRACMSGTNACMHAATDTLQQDMQKESYQAPTQQYFTSLHLHGPGKPSAHGRSQPAHGAIRKQITRRHAAVHDKRMPGKQAEREINSFPRCRQPPPPRIGCINGSSQHSNTRCITSSVMIIDTDSGAGDELRATCARSATQRQVDCGSTHPFIDKTNAKPA
jgi:hypothetical protein